MQHIAPVGRARSYVLLGMAAPAGRYVLLQVAGPLCSGGCQAGASLCSPVLVRVAVGRCGVAQERSVKHHKEAASEVGVGHQRLDAQVVVIGG